VLNWRYYGTVEPLDHEKIFPLKPRVQEIFIGEEAVALTKAIAIIILLVPLKAHQTCLHESSHP